ncbi:MAG TPA: DCC1-like thiol-disulfide oxidoreductase family protein [Verrucomicrobiae bacterium]|nr:DCC1-like thiol-disulfide oxidoreductase family protein [Verrucomicrobiae bacterium]
MTDIKNANGWVCFDAQCGLCASLARCFEPLLHRHGFVLLPLQTPWVRDRLANTGEEPLAEMRLIRAEGRVHGGIEALAQIARLIWWAKPVYWVSQTPLVSSVFRSGYRWLARNRTCLRGSCAVTESKFRQAVNAFGWLAALLPMTFALGFGGALPGWVWMWTIAFALYLGAKLITILNLLRTGHRAGPRLLAYAVLWPGMDARAFCGSKLIQPQVIREWALAATKALIGAVLIWFGVPFMASAHSLIAGWFGMFGIVLLLHCGFFHLLSLLWRARGINARPIMQSPATAASLSEFWGGRWNAGFSDLMHKNLFTPVSRRIGSRRALFLIFLISGILHESVISVPAHGGYGLPAAYFVVQGLAVLFEHSGPGRKLGLGSGFRGWCFVTLVAGLPAFWLFPPVFIHHVILPMLHAIGAT